LKVGGKVTTFLKPSNTNGFRQDFPLKSVNGFQKEFSLKNVNGFGQDFPA